MTSSTNAYSRLQTKGYEPEALLNFVALMGWSPQSSSSDTPDPSTIPTSSSPRDASNEEVLPLAALVQAFSLEGVNKNRATMQGAKLDFLNRAHVRIKLADAAPGGGREDVARRTCAVVSGKWPELAGEKVDEPYIARVLDALKVRPLFPPASPSSVSLTAAATDTHARACRTASTRSSTCLRSAPTSSTRPSSTRRSRRSSSRASLSRLTVRPSPSLSLCASRRGRLDVRR